MSIARQCGSFGRRIFLDNRKVHRTAGCRTVSARNRDGDDGRIVEAENIALKALIVGPLDRFGHAAAADAPSVSVDGDDARRRSGQAALAVVGRHACDGLRKVSRDAVQDSLQFVHPLVDTAVDGRHFGEALGEEGVEDAEILADVNVVVKLGVALVLGQGARDLDEVLLHGSRLLLQKVVHKLHKVLLALEARKVGERLEGLGDQRQITGRLLARILASNSEKARREDSRAKEAEENGGGYQVIRHFLPSKTNQSLAISVETFLKFPVDRKRKKNGNFIYFKLHFKKKKKNLTLESMASN